MEDDLNVWAKWKTTSIFGQNRRQPQFLGKMEFGNLTLILREMEYDLNFCQAQLQLAISVEIELS
jgi:hypothetical protein